MGINNMSEEPSSKFKMRMDDDSSDTLVQEALTDRRMDKLNSRVTWVVILLPVLVILIIVLTYIDLTQRVLRYHDTGSTEVQALAGNLQDRFSSLSVKQAKIDEIHKEISTSVKRVGEKVEKDLGALETRIQQTTETLGQTITDGNELKNTLADFKKTLDPIRKDLNTVSAALGNLDKKFQKELTQLNGSLADFNDSMTDLNKRIDGGDIQRQTLKKEIADLSSKKIEQRDIASALDEEKKIYREMIGLIAKKLDGRLDEIHNEIESLKRTVRAVPDTSEIRVRTEPTAVNPGSQPANPPPDSAQPGGIVERSLE